MCFVVPKNGKAKIAKKDIVCWKALESGNHAFFKSTFKYRVGKKNRVVKLVLHCGVCNRLIYKGYHSYKLMKDAKSLLFWLTASCGPFVAKFIIPAGTTYYENKSEYVSETIIML